MKLHKKVFFTPLIFNTLCMLNTLHAAEPSTKKRKIDSVSQVKKCLCQYCSSAYGHLEELNQRDCIIAQAFLTTPLPAVLADMVYNYAGWGLHNITSLSTRGLDVKLRNYLAEQTVSQVRLLVNATHTPTILRPGKIIHIVPPEITFDALSFQQASDITFNHPPQQTTILRSLCGRYCVEFAFEKITPFCSSPQLSTSQGWKKAMKEFNQKNAALQ